MNLGLDYPKYISALAAASVKARTLAEERWGVIVDFRVVRKIVEDAGQDALLDFMMIELDEEQLVEVRWRSELAAPLIEAMKPMGHYIRDDIELRAFQDATETYIDELFSV